MLEPAVGCCGIRLGVQEATPPTVVLGWKTYTAGLSLRYTRSSIPFLVKASQEVRYHYHPEDI